MSRRLKLRQLEVMLAVAQSGSMAKASTQLAITQPVISKSIADLETTLNVKLFDRTSRGVQPTLYGQALLERTIALFNDLRTSVSELQFLADSTAGELRIGSSDAVAAGMLGVIVDRLVRRYPRLTFDAIMDIYDLPHQHLRARAIDLIIGRLPSTMPDDMDVLTLYEEQAFVVAGAQNPLTRRRKVKLAEILNEPWCGQPFDIFPWSLMGDAFRARGLPPPRNVLKTRSMLARHGLLATGRYLSIFPRTVLHFSGGLSLKRVPIDIPAPTYPVGVVTLKNRTLNPVARLFIDCAREVAKPFSGGS